jgi:hypothetical protein
MTGQVLENPSQPFANQAALYLEGSMQANRDNEDAPEEHHEIADAEQSQPRLVC